MSKFLFIAISLLLACLPSLAADQRGAWEADCQCWRNAVWGPETWSIGKRQDLDYWPAGKSGSPLIIYAHPNGAGGGGGSKRINVGSPMYQKIIEPARAAGYAVASIEFRHPVSDSNIVFPTAHDDITQAVRWLKDRADLYKFDLRNVFFLGHSRGSLVLWTAIHYSTDPTVRANAVYTFQGQSTYRDAEQAEAFVILAEQAQFIADFNAQYQQTQLFGSAAADVTPTAPPLMLKYKEPFYRRPVPADVVGVHHPDNGLYLCAAYAAKAPLVPCTAIDRIPGDRGYDGFTDFFDRYRVR